MRVLLIDDEELALDVLERMLSKIEGIEIVGKYADPQFAFQELARLQVEVIFLDMDMGEVHGIEFAERLMADYSHIEILFVTAYPQFALEAFEVNAIDYLLKPVSIERLKRAISKTRAKIDVYKVKKEPSMQTAQLLYAYTMNSFRFIDFQQNQVKWRTRKVKELFVFLWHHRENPIHKSRVIEELWPEMNISKSVTLLHTTVYQLRKTLKDIEVENPISLVNDHYILSVPLASDIIELEDIVQTVEIKAANIERILELYNGDYLEEEDYTWAFQDQQRIKQSMLRYLEKFVIEQKAEEENTFLVEACLEKILKLDIYNEAYMFKLLEHYGRTKNTQKLTALFQTIKETLEDELGIDVPDKMVELYNDYFR